MNEKDIKMLHAEINYILDSILTQMDLNDYIRIRDVYFDSYRLPEFQTIKHQICKCIILGQYIAAITLTNHLLEKVLKFSLNYNFSRKNGGDKDEPFSIFSDAEKGNVKYDKANLYDNINYALEEKLISEDEAKKLKEMKDCFRNSYSHSDRQGIYGDASVGVTEVRGHENAEKFIKGDESGMPKKEEKMRNIPIADFIFINYFAKKDCIPYLTDLHEIILNIEERLFVKLDSGNNVSSDNEEKT